MRGSIRRSTRRSLAVTAAAAALLLAGCSSAAQGPQQVLSEVDARANAAAGASAAAAAAPPAQVSAAPENCAPGAQVSYAPLPSLPSPGGSMPAGSLEADIAKRGRLVVGVSGDTRLLGARNQLRRGELEGFDIDIARSVARAIFGDPNRVQFKVITAAERIKLVQAGVDNGGVDLVARAMTMTCDRWNDVAFSASYFAANQLMLAPKDTADLSSAALAKARARVCAPSGSTSLAKIQQIQGIRPVAVEIHSDCLALLQEGRVDAITGDDAILAGFQDQDPRVTLGKEDQLGAQPYGLAMSKSHPEFVRFVNAVLASPAGREAWTTAYANSGLLKWLGPKTEPAPQYGR